MQDINHIWNAKLEICQTNIIEQNRKKWMWHNLHNEPGKKLWTLTCALDKYWNNIFANMCPKIINHCEDQTFTNISKCWAIYSVYGLYHRREQEEEEKREWGERRRSREKDFNS